MPFPRQLRTIYSFLNEVYVLPPSALRGGEKPSWDKGGKEGTVRRHGHHQTNLQLPRRWPDALACRKGLTVLHIPAEKASAGSPGESPRGGGCGGAARIQPLQKQPLTSGAGPPQTTGRAVRTSKPETGPLAQMLGAAAGR